MDLVGIFPKSSCSDLQILEAVLKEVIPKLGAKYCNKSHRLDMDPKLDSTKRLDSNPDSVDIFPKSSCSHL